MLTENINKAPSAINKITSSVKDIVDKNTYDDKKTIGYDISFTDVDKILASYDKKYAEILTLKGIAPSDVEDLKQKQNQLENLNIRIQTLKQEIDTQKKQIDVELKRYMKLNKSSDDYESRLQTSLLDINTIMKNSLRQAEDVKEISLTYSFNNTLAWKNIADEMVYEQFKPLNKNTAGKKYITGFLIEHQEIFNDKNDKIETWLKSNYSENNQPDYVKFIKEIFLKDDKEKEKTYPFFFIRDAHKFNISKYKNISINYGTKSIQSASFGEKSTAAIIVLLTLGNKPLIIDEPENHLDSKLISSYLVPLIKETKKSKQIIFATHNANFVINALDAEKIFILDTNKDGMTEIIPTTIEDLEHRHKLLRLEGSKEAFKQRSDKLGINLDGGKE